MCTSEWKWFTFEIRQKTLSFSIHRRDNTLMLTDHSPIPAEGMDVALLTIKSKS